MTTIQERVEAGAKWLDENRPGWVDRINLETLDLGSPCRCVLGQEFGHYGDANHTAQMNIDLGLLAAAEHIMSDDTADDMEFEYEWLTAAWRDYITARRAAA